MRRAIVRAGLTLVVLAVAALAIVTAFDVARAPWSRSFGLWPTLAGDWTGELVTADGRAQPVFFAIRGWVPRRGRPFIEGRARLCDDNGSVRDLQISGRPDDWRGTRFQVSIAGTNGHDSRLVPGDLHGEWQGDAIRAAGVLVSGGPVATADVSRQARPAEPPRVHYALRRGSEREFLAACQKVAGRH
jgi:hypothetical protein